MVVVMNVVQAVEGRERDFERAFLERERLLAQAAGFRGFELLRRSEGREYVVLTRWERQEDFRAWVASDLFRRSHRHRHGELAEHPDLRVYEVLDVEAPSLA